MMQLAQLKIAAVAGSDTQKDYPSCCGNLTSEPTAIFDAQLNSIEQSHVKTVIPETIDLDLNIDRVAGDELAIEIDSKASITQRDSDQTERKPSFPSELHEDITSIPSAFRDAASYSIETEEVDHTAGKLIAEDSETKTILQSSPINELERKVCPNFSIMPHLGASQVDEIVIDSLQSKQAIAVLKSQFPGIKVPIPKSLIVEGNSSNGYMEKAPVPAILTSRTDGETAVLPFNQPSITAPVLRPVSNASVSNRIITPVIGETLWISELRTEIAQSQKTGDTLTLKLRPSTLGELRIEIDQQDNAHKIKMTVDNEAARLIIVSAQSRLEQELRTFGGKLAFVDVAQEAYSSDQSMNRDAEQNKSQYLSNPDFEIIRSPEVNSEQRVQVNHVARFA